MILSKSIEKIEECEFCDKKAEYVIKIVTFWKYKLFLVCKLHKRTKSALELEHIV